jgi:hypothetical protein
MSEGQIIETTGAVVRLDPRVRLTPLPVCVNCKKVAPKCECGRPTRNGSKS